MMIESAGFEVIDLGVDVPASKIIECYKENPDVKVIALSALLTTTMPSLKDTVAAINAEDFRGKVKCIGWWCSRSQMHLQKRLVQMDIPRMQQVQPFSQKLW